MKNSNDGIGVIGNMASCHAHICTLNKAAYNIVKFGLRALSQSIASEGDGKIRFNNPRAIDAVDRLLKYTDFEFECSEIIGRRFENIDDHAAYLRDGGCSRIIEVLANE